MKKIDKATTEQAGRLFDIMTQAVTIGCAPSYPDEVLRAWHHGYSVSGLAEVISKGNVYSLQEGDTLPGFIEFADSEIMGLFVDPADHGKGYGARLVRFAAEQMPARPLIVFAGLNAVPFYEKLGFRKLGLRVIRRNDRDIYVEKMELV